eukprot:SAG31_NODE_1567_length_7859_cov_18.238531_7_plen_148_part_00
MVVLELYHKGVTDLIESIVPNVVLPLRAQLDQQQPGGGRRQRLSRVLLTYKVRCPGRKFGTPTSLRLIQYFCCPCFEFVTTQGRPSAADNPICAAALRGALPSDVAVSAVWSAKNAYVGTGKSARYPHDSREVRTDSYGHLKTDHRT